MIIENKSMNEEKAKEILRRSIQFNNCLDSSDFWNIWEPGQHEVCLDGRFTAMELEAIAWWMRNKSKSPHQDAMEGCRYE